MNVLRQFFKPIHSLYIALFFSFCLLFYVIYASHSADLKRDLKNEARHISSTIQEIFDLASQVTSSFSKQISASGTDDMNTIMKIMGHKNYVEENDTLSWVIYGWVNSKGQLVFNRDIGRINSPIDLSNRPFVQNSLKEPWKFFTSQAVIGATTGLRIIPGGMGVTDHKGRLLGAVVSAFKLVDLNSKVKQKLSMANFMDTNISYIVLDKDLHIVLHSPDNEIDIESSYYKDILGNINVFLNDEGNFAEPIKSKDITYTHYKKVKSYPYYVLTGYNHKIVKSYLLWKLLPFIIAFIIMGIGCMILVYFNRKQILKYSGLSEKARLNFLKRIKNEMRAPLNLILTYSEIINKSLKGEIDIPISVEKQTELINKIHKAALNLDNLTTDTLELSCINVNSIIQECILIHLQASLLREVKIKTSLYPHLPPFFADELRFKQVIIGLISLSLEYSPKRTLIKISSGLKSLDDQNFFELIIQDNGFSLNEEAINRIHERLEGSATGDDINFEFSAIKKLIHLHGGTLHLESEWKQGKKITVLFPYRLPDQSENELKEANISNVYSLFKKELIR